MARIWLEALGPGQRRFSGAGKSRRLCSWRVRQDLQLLGGLYERATTTRAANRERFPYLRIRGNVALIGATSARATAPFMATGFFRAGQPERLWRVLQTRPASAGLFRIVMIHHPPVRDAVPQHKRLFGIGRFQRVIRRHGAELVLHGHSHLPTLFPSRPSGPVPVVGVAATGQSPGGQQPAAQWNMFDIAGEPGKWAAAADPSRPHRHLLAAFSPVGVGSDR